MKKGDVQIRKIVDTDAKSIAQNLNNKNVWNGLRDYVPHPYTIDDGHAYIKMIKESELNHAYGILYNNDFAGIIGFHLQQDVYRHSAEVGYWLGEPYWGKGIASTALPLIVKIAFDEHDLKKLFAGVFANNAGSIRVLEKSGFTKEGTGKNSIIKNGKYLDEVRYGLLNPTYF